MMFSFPNVGAGDYIGRIDTGTLWNYDGNVFADTGEPFTFTSIVNLENEVEAILLNVTQIQQIIQDIADQRVYEMSKDVSWIKSHLESKENQNEN